MSERARAASPSGFSTAVEAARRSAPLLASVSRVVQRRGEALAPADRAFFEPRFGRDLSHVRVHRGDADARNTTGSLNSAAYTVGSHIVLGAEADAGGYGRRVLAHELAHVEQHQLQSGGTAGIHIGEPTDLAETQADSRASEVMQTAPRAFARGDPVAASSSGVLRRWSLKESAHKALERIKGAFDPRTRQFASDLWASIKESPSHLGEFFSDELLPSIQAHLPSVIGVTLGLLGAEAIIGGLEATPTGVTQIVGAILEVIVVAVLGYFAAVETSGAVDEAMHWVRQAKEANGDPKQITEASRSFVRMLWHIFMAVLTIAGVRARLKGGALGRIKAPFEEPPPPSTPPELRAFRGGKSGPVPMENGKVVSPRGSSTVGASRTPRVGRGGVALAEPEVAPEVKPTPLPGPKAVPDFVPESSPQPTPAVRAGPTALTPRVQGGPAVAAGVAAASKPDPRKFYPLFWSPLLPPVTSRVFVRTPGRERDTRKAAQALLENQRREFDDPGFRARSFHVHHVIPLFLGGPDDLIGNGTTWPGRVHLKGHRDLRSQPQMQTPPSGLSPLPVDLYDHPPGTLYVLTGYKGAPGAPPCISPGFNEPGDPSDADFEGE